MLRIAVAGVAGRMGKTLVEAVVKMEGVALGAASVNANSRHLEMDAGQLCGLPEQGIFTVDNLGDVLDDFDVLIDFTSPQASLKHLEICVAAGKRMVIGTTGFAPKQQEQIQGASAKAPIVYAPNMSIGVNLCFKLLETAASVVGEDFDIEVMEIHHRHKKDAPSGTALKMGEVVAAVLGRELKDCAIYGRKGLTGERDGKTIGFASLRGGDAVGDHSVIFAGPGERIEITHKSNSRMTYASGAVRAALWLRDKRSGLYDMRDVLGI